MRCGMSTMRRKRGSALLRAIPPLMLSSMAPIRLAGGLCTHRRARTPSRGQRETRRSEQQVKQQHAARPLTSTDNASCYHRHQNAQARSYSAPVAIRNGPACSTRTRVPLSPYSARTTSVSASPNLSLLSLLTFAVPCTDFFDTSDYVHRLEQQGLTRKQADGVVDALEDIIGEAISNLQGSLVTRTEHYKVCTINLHLAAERADPLLVDSTMTARRSGPPSSPHSLGFR